MILPRHLVKRYVLHSLDLVKDGNKGDAHLFRRVVKRVGQERKKACENAVGKRLIHQVTQTAYDGQTHVGARGILAKSTNDVGQNLRRCGERKRLPVLAEDAKYTRDGGEAHALICILEKRGQEPKLLL